MAEVSMMYRVWLMLVLVAVSWTVTKSAKLRSTESVSTRNFDVLPSNRTQCQSGQTPPPNRYDSTEQLRQLRAEMATLGLDAYLVVMTDEHGAYSGTGHDARVAYISGFTGSNGWAVVTANKSAVWTDGRYFLQAGNQMDCQWSLMEMGTPGFPQNTWSWLKEVLPVNSAVGAYPNLIGRSTWDSHHTNLLANNLTFQAVNDELVDKIWTTNRPPRPNELLLVHNSTFTGELWSEKLQRVRQKMSDSEARVLVVTVLEQVAWLFNIRGADRTSSLFYGYAIIRQTDARLYVQNHVTLLTNELRAHLNVDSNGTCLSPASNSCVHVLEYDHVYNDTAELSTGLKVWIDPSANQAIFSAASTAQDVLVQVSPIELMKSIKNEVERQHFTNCILRDSAAVIEFAALLEEQIKAGYTNWTELKVSERINALRSEYQHFRGLSFDTIAAYGPNAAVIHYRPTTDTDTTISTNNVFLLDSGGQYLDGTTDVTRTFHYGTPTDRVKEAYTRVLMGQIDLAQTVWTEGIYGYEIDIRARSHLYEHGWDYNHGTGHGIGYFLSVHEGPGRINKGYNSAHEYLREGMFFSDEPGYYEDNNFGIRLENLVTVVPANTPNNFGSSRYLTFKTLTLVPYERELIKIELLNEAQIAWLNAYHAECLEKLGDYLHGVRNNHKAHMWLMSKTAPLNSANSGSSFIEAASSRHLLIVGLLSVVIASILSSK